jgi:hypothetical protein
VTQACAESLLADAIPPSVVGHTGARPGARGPTLTLCRFTAQDRAPIAVHKEEDVAFVDQLAQQVTQWLQAGSLFPPACDVVTVVLDNQTEADSDGPAQISTGGDGCISSVAADAAT